MNGPIQVYEKGSKRLEIFYDDCPQDPREYAQENDVAEESDSCWGFYGDEGIQQILSETGFVQKDAVHAAVHS